VRSSSQRKPAKCPACFSALPAPSERGRAYRDLARTLVLEERARAFLRRGEIRDWRTMAYPCAAGALEFHLDNAAAELAGYCSHRCRDMYEQNQEWNLTRDLVLLSLLGMEGAAHASP
jgi:hypothetical protein